MAPPQRLSQIGQSQRKAARSQAAVNRGRALQVNRLLSRYVPATLRRNAARDASAWLWPSMPDTYRNTIAGLLGVPWHTARHWLRGTRPLPRWARDRLAEAVRARLEQGAAALAELEAMAVYEPKRRLAPKRKSPPTEASS